jgi:uncharacterized cupin superfamily protein
MDGYTVKQIDEMQALHDGLVKLAGAELGVESFGIQLLEFPAGFDHYPEHDHAADGQEEVYVVLRGDAELTVDGDTMTLDPGRIVRVSPTSTRTMRPGSDGVRILAIGRPIAGAYERPDDFCLEAGR